MEPDSISSNDDVPYFKFSLRERRILKTEAASVDEMTEPISMLSAQPREGKKGKIEDRKYTNTPTIPAVSAVPAKERSSALPATGRASLKFVPKPP